MSRYNSNFIGDYYAGPSPFASGLMSFGQALGQGFADRGAAIRQRELDQQAEARRQQEDAWKQTQMQWQTDDRNDQMLARKTGGLLASGQLDGSMGQYGRTGEEMTTKFGYNPMEYLQPQDVAMMEKRKTDAAKMREEALNKIRANQANYIMTIQNPAEQRVAAAKFKQMFNEDYTSYGDAGLLVKMREAEANRDLRMQLEELRGQNKQPQYQMTTINTPEGPKVVAVDPANPQAQPVTIGPAMPRSGEALKTIPHSAAASITESFGLLGRIDEAMRALDANPNAIGYGKGILNDYGPEWINYSDPEGAAARAALGDLGSAIIRDRSGAAVTAAEFPRLRPFIPSVYDSPETAKKKLQRFREVVAEETQLYADNYSEDMGYKRPESWSKYLGGHQAQGAVSPSGAAGTSSGQSAADAAADALIKKHSGGGR